MEYKNNENIDEKESFDNELKVSIIDPIMILELEQHAKSLASDITLMLQKLKTQFSQFSSLSLETLKVYQESSQSILEMYKDLIEINLEVIHKCQSLDKELVQVSSVKEQLRSVKLALDALEGLL